MSNVYPLDLKQNYRQAAPEPKPGADITVVTDNPDIAQFDPESGTLQIPLEDGSVQVSFGEPTKPKKDTDFDDNLAEELTDAELSTIAEKLLLGIDQDLQSRSQWLENMSGGISLLGLEIKNPRGAATSGATPQEGVSTVDHPLLLEAVLRFQANARGELLPTDGPVKVRNDGEGTDIANQLAQALEKDLNHYLTKVAKEYYPDTDRMLLMLGFSGISFKKGYHCPIKRRPVIASINAEDLIVSNAATDIDGAGRVTHRINMRPAVLKRMQLLGAYRDVPLPLQSLPSNKDAVKTKIDQVQGIAPPAYVDQTDQDRELYECYCEIEIPGFEHELDGELTGLPLPYKVVIDKDARKILEIRRNWEQDDVFCMPRNRIIAYIFIPGLGFYGIGLLNILGNATKAVTAAWRLMIDAGMFANFPGFLYLKSLAKQLTNQFRIPPGGGMPIDTMGQDIRASVMPLPYKDPSAVFIQLIENIAQTAQRVGGTAELQVGEGKQDAPVGTTLAMIEQATKLMSAVHKRLHQAQGQEFDMLKSLLMEDPEALWRHNKKSKVLEILKAQYGMPADLPTNNGEEGTELRHRQMFLAALGDCDLMPAADPNTSSQTERYLKVVAMRQMAMTNQNIDINAVDERAFQVMGIDDAQSLFKPPPDPNSPQPPPPEQVTAQATMTVANARMMDAQSRQQESQIKAQMAQTDAQNKQADLAVKQKIASLGVARELIIHRDDTALAHQQLQSDNQHRTADRQQGLALAAMDNHASMMDRQHQAQQSSLDRAHEAQQGVAANQHSLMENQLDHNQDLMQQGVAHSQNLQQGQVEHVQQVRQGLVGHQQDLMQAQQAHEHKLEQMAKMPKPTTPPARGKKGKTS